MSDQGRSVSSSVTPFLCGVVCILIGVFLIRFAGGPLGWTIGGITVVAGMWAMWSLKGRTAEMVTGTERQLLRGEVREDAASTNNPEDSSDVGLGVLKSIYDRLIIDDDWAVRAERGFTWWSSRLAQNVFVDKPEYVTDRDVQRVHIWTDVVTDIDLGTHPAAQLSVANMTSTMSAFAWNSTENTIRLHCMAFAHSDNADDVAWLLSVAAILQIIEAHDCADRLAFAVNGKVATRPHPISGLHAEADPVLIKSRKVLLAPKENVESEFVGIHTGGLESFAHDLGIVGNGSPTGFSCELPFRGSGRPVALVAAGDSHPDLETALLQIESDAVHPEYGEGALIVLRIPEKLGKEDACAIANEFNLRAVDDTAPLIGAWCQDPSDLDFLAFNCFIPSALARPGLLENQILYCMRHAQFAAELLPNR